MSDARALIDTNVLLYLYSSANLEKQNRAASLVGDLTRSGRALTSTQIVQEFYVNARKIGISNVLRAQAIDALFQLPLIVIHEAEIRVAIRKQERFQISFWDALLFAAAEAGGADVLYTEDLNHGQRYGTVLVQNPFSSPQS